MKECKYESTQDWGGATPQIVKAVLDNIGRRYLVEHWENEDGSQEYDMYSDGFIVQRCKYALNGNSLTFPKEFRDLNYIISIGTSFPKKMQIPLLLVPITFGLGLEFQINQPLDLDLVEMPHRQRSILILSLKATPPNPTAKRRFSFACFGGIPFCARVI